MRWDLAGAVSRWIAVGLALVMLGMGYAHAAKPDLWDGSWHYSITAYGWLPGISLTTRYQTPSGTVQNRTDNDIYDYLSGAFMLAGEARKGKWGVYTDLDWVDFSNEKGRITSVGGDNAGADLGLDTRWDLSGEMVNLSGIYSLGHGARGNVDLLFGMRYLHLIGSLDWNASVAGNGGRVNRANSGHASGHAHFTAAIVGLKGAWKPFHRGRYFFPWYLDMGTGDSIRTWQIMVGVARSFSWGYIALRYRELDYHRSGGQQFLQKARLSGPTISATWIF